MSENHYKTDRLSFWQLLSKTHKIEIPIIQRDYAQGRSDKIKIRELLLQSFENAIEKSPIELDFIYGDLKNDILQPLDGQQRLTTLFLLHWYIATKENKNKVNVTSNLKKFSYETRSSSRDFCSRLIEKGVHIKNDMKLSEVIKDASWFLKAWENDPTISAMLNMIDAIHSRFANKREIWDKLISENCPIVFQNIELKNLDLSDDLYIKMNARGKQLTPFEQFKASFEKKIEIDCWDNTESVTETFSHKADTKWTDLFWKHSINNEKTFDNAYITFIANAVLTSVAKEKSTQLSKEQREKKIQELINFPENITAEHLDKNAFNLLCDYLDLYCHESNYNLSFTFPFWQHLRKEDTLFTIIINGKQTSYSQRVLFYAQTECLLKIPGFDIKTINCWMRVIRNIVQNSTLDSAESFISAINLVNELSQGCSNIYHFLSNNSIKSNFAKPQVEEEILKAKLIQKISDPKILFETEDTNFCKGRISFPLYCIGYLTEFNDFNPENLSQVKDVLSKYLSETDINNDFRRALLTIGDNCFYNYWDTSWVFAVNAPKRKLIENIEDLKKFAYNKDYSYGSKQYREYLKDLIIKLTVSNLNYYLNNYLPPESMPNWKKRIIKEKNLLDYSEKHFIAIKGDNSCCYLLPQSRVANTAEGKEKCKLVN